MFNIENVINSFLGKYKNKAFALKDWKALKAKPFSVKDMIVCIANEADGNIDEMAKIIDHLTEKHKVQGRSQVYAELPLTTIDIIRDENGELKLKGYNPDAKLQLKGQHKGPSADNKKHIFKKDGTVNKNYQRSEDKLYDLGKKVREMYPDADNHFITFAMQAIKNFAIEKKKNPLDVANRIEKGRYKLDTDEWTVMKNESLKRRTIVINESDIARISDFIEMTEHKFHTHLRKFISQLLQDPVNAQPSDLFIYYDFNRSRLLSILINNGVICRHEHISDKDENGEPKTATMMVKFSCPKKNFDRKLQKLFIKLFEKNLPERKKKESNLDETTAAGGAPVGDGAGQFAQPTFPVQRRSMYKPKNDDLDESTTTMNTGEYQYTVPVGCVDKGDETLRRKNGKCGSTSIPKEHV